MAHKTVPAVLASKTEENVIFHVAVEGHDGQSFGLLMKAAENIPVNLETQNRFFFKKYYQLRLKKKN